MNLKEKLTQIQVKLKAPKNLRNTFGNYNYRNCESILEAVKPFLDEYKVCLTVEDDIKVVGDRFYVKSIATLFDNESDEKISNIAFARESLDKKGMDASQVTGATSSYARKYSLNGLFLLDDTADTESTEFKTEAETKKKKQIKEESKEMMNDLTKKKTISQNEALTLEHMCEADSINPEYINSSYKVSNFMELTPEQYAQVIKNWEVVKSKPNAHISKDK